MGVHASAWAWKQAVGAVPKLVLLALADRADDAGTCWPGIADLAAKCRLDRRSIQRHIRTLEAHGLLSIEVRPQENGRNSTNLYHLAVPRWAAITPSTPDRTVGGGRQNHHPVGDTGVIQVGGTGVTHLGDTGAALTISRNHQRELSGDAPLPPVRGGGGAR